MGIAMVHQTEKHKMLTGQIYRSGDDLLREERRQAKKLLKVFNDTDPGELEKRVAILNELFGAAGSNLEIEPPFYCDYGYNISVGNNFYANHNCIVLDCAPVVIGDDVFLGPNVQLYTATHPLEAKERDKGLEAAIPISIEDSVWIGGSAVINPGVTIGRGTTIGSGSVVTRNMPANVFAAGNPCKVIRNLADV
ncbi:sugar O-acetyltransferase [Nitrosospira briensis]|nr:sugar O-acetyltransferase [Nitrosospira briensis]